MSYLVVFAFIVNPILTLPFVVIELLNRKPYALVLFSIFMGLLGFILIPSESSDITRIYDIFNQLQHASFGQFLEFSRTQLDFLLYLYAWILGKIGLSKQFLQFTTLFVTYYLIFKVYFDWSAKVDLDKVKKFVFFIFILFFIPFLSTYSGMRNNTALAFFIYGVYCLHFKNSKRGYVFILLSLFTHFMAILLVLLYLIAKFVNVSTKKIRYIYLFSFVLLVIPGNPIISWLNTLSVGFDFLEQRQVSYLGGSEWSGFFLSGMSLKGKVFFVLTMLPYYWLLIYLIATIKDSFLRKYAYILGVFTNVLSAVPGTLYKRYCVALVFLGVLILLDEYKVKEWYESKKKYIYMFIIFFIIMRLSDVFTMRYSVSKSYNRIYLYSTFNYFTKDFNKNDYVPDR